MVWHCQPMAPNKKLFLSSCPLQTSPQGQHSLLGMIQSIQHPCLMIQQLWEDVAAAKMIFFWRRGGDFHRCGGSCSSPAGICHLCCPHRAQRDSPGGLCATNPPWHRGTPQRELAGCCVMDKKLRISTELVLKRHFGGW